MTKVAISIAALVLSSLYGCLPARAQAVRCPDEAFSVYFEWGRLSISSVAQDTIAGFLDQTKKRGCIAQMFEIVGHLDTSESQTGMGFEASVARAEAVQRELRRVGVSDALMEVEGLSDTQGAVATGPDVRQPLNRRVDVLVRFRQVR